MRRLRERCRAILWVNPLLDRPDYEPRSPAMLAALPAVDRFLSLPELRAALAPVGAALDKLCGSPVYNEPRRYIHH